MHDLAQLVAVDIRFHLDGAQGPGCVPVDFRLLGCDYYSACGHKWLLGPKGTGAFFCHEDVLDRTEMSWTGSHSTLSYDQEGGYELIPEARRFEFGTRALATFAGFDAALSWMESIGMDRILNRVDELVAYAASKLHALEWLSLQGSAKDRGAIFSFTMAGAAHAHDISTILDKKGIAVRAGQHCAGPLMDHLGINASCRASFAFYNTKQEVDTLVDGLHLAKDLLG